MVWQIISVIAVFISVVACVIAVRALSHAASLQKLFSDNEQSSNKQQAVNKNEIEEIRAGLLKIGKHVIELQSQTQDLSQKQQDIQFADPESKIYTRAVKMIELGADIEEVMGECELPRAEAELLFTLHQRES